MTPPDVITEGLMMTPLEKSLEELELIGDENMMKRRGGQRTVASNLMSAIIINMIIIPIVFTQISLAWLCDALLH